METLHALQKVTAGIDVHRMLLVVTVLIEHEDGTVGKEQRQFGGFKRDKRALERHVLQYGRRRSYYLQLLRSSSTPAQSAPTSH